MSANHFQKQNIKILEKIELHWNVYRVISEFCVFRLNMQLPYQDCRLVNLPMFYVDVCALLASNRAWSRVVIITAVYVRLKILQKWHKRTENTQGNCKHTLMFSNRPSKSTEPTIPRWYSRVWFPSYIFIGKTWCLTRSWDVKHHLFSYLHTLRCCHVVNIIMLILILIH